MLLIVNTEPPRYVAVCETCKTREGPVEGARDVAVEHFTRLAWRLDEGFTRTTICPKCAGPPSVFPAARVAAGDPPTCTACLTPIRRCVVCAADFMADGVISCRGARGHSHARCSTQKLRRFLPPT